MERKETYPEVVAGTSESDLRSTIFAGVAANGPGDFARVAHGIKRAFRRGLGAVQLFEDRGHSYFVGGAGDGAALEHALDGVEGGVVEAFAEGEMQGASVRGDVNGNGASGYKQG